MSGCGPKTTVGSFEIENRIPQGTWVVDYGRSSHAWDHACVGPPLKQCADQSRKVKGLLSHWLVSSSGSFFRHDHHSTLSDPMES